MFCLNSAAEVLILLSLFVPQDIPMANVLIVVALAGVGAYLVRRVLRHAPMARGIDAGAVSHSWIAEHRREEPR
jgi:hypothetical protein